MSGGNVLKPPTPTRRRRHSRERGQALIILVICFFVVLGFAGLAADAGHDYVMKRDVQNAADAAALAAGKQLVSAVQTGPPLNSNAAAPTAANGFAADNGFKTTLSTACDTYSSTSFTAVWVDTGSCSNSSSANTVVTVHDPPVAAPDGTPSPSKCAARPYNCFQVIITTKVHNYIMGVLGFPTTTVTANAVVDATPQGTGYPAPPPIALDLYEPTSAFDATQAPSRSQLTCSAGSTAGTTTCPTFWTEQGGQPIIQGVDGTNLNPVADSVAVESNGDMVIQGQTTICDPYGGKAPCKNNQETGSSCPGCLGWAVPAGASYFCQKLNNNQPGGCSTGAQTHLDQLWGDQTAYATPTSYTPTVTLPTNFCGGLVLNGESVLNDISSGPCAPPSSEPYDIMPGIYSYIVINHGSYEFAPGVFDVTGLAPVNSNGPTNGCQGANNGSNAYTANGIDHCRESNNDVDLCTNANQNAKACPSLTAGVWIGHGGGTYGAFVASQGSNCNGGSSGTDGGGGDNTQVTGYGVTFVLGPSSGGFVSTNDVQLIGLTAPGPGANDNVGDEPLLIDEQNNGFIHLDAGNPPGGNAYSQFSGIVYQTPSAIGGGVEMNNALSHNNGGGLVGQILAYSFASWGNGTAVDFSQGFGQSSNPVITTSGNAEQGLIGTPSPGVTAAVDHNGNAITGYETFTINYNDEWALDGYDTYIKVNGGTPVFFSQNEWGPQPSSSFDTSEPPEGNAAQSGSGSNYNINPNDYTSSSVTDAAWPVDSQAGTNWPSGAGTVTYPSGASAGYTVYLDSKTGLYDDWVETIGSGSTASYFETLGAWMWGHQSDLNGSHNGTYDATIKYTFPTPTGSSVGITIFITDGDHCGDYATASYTFSNVGQPNSTGPSSGSVELLE